MKKGLPHVDVEMKEEEWGRGTSYRLGVRDHWGTKKKCRWYGGRIKKSRGGGGGEGTSLAA